MRSNDGRPRAGGRTDPRRHAPGSRPARLAEASKQLAILLEDVDLDDEPDLGRALTDAVTAVDRAAGLVDWRDGEESGARERLVEDAGGDRRPTRPEDDRREGVIESGGLTFVGEAGAE